MKHLPRAALLMVICVFSMTCCSSSTSSSSSAAATTTSPSHHSDASSRDLYVPMVVEYALVVGGVNGGGSTNSSNCTNHPTCVDQNGEAYGCCPIDSVCCGPGMCCSGEGAYCCTDIQGDPVSCCGDTSLFCNMETGLCADSGGIEPYMDSLYLLLGIVTVAILSTMMITLSIVCRRIKEMRRHRSSGRSDPVANGSDDDDDDDDDERPSWASDYRGSLVNTSASRGRGDAYIDYGYRSRVQNYGAIRGPRHSRFTLLGANALSTTTIGVPPATLRKVMPVRLYEDILSSGATTTTTPADSISRTTTTTTIATTNNNKNKNKNNNNNNNKNNNSSITTTTSGVVPVAASASLNEASCSPKCCICLDHFRPQSKCRALPCGHIFHYVCIDEWFLEHDTCPLCVRRVNE